MQAALGAYQSWAFDRGEFPFVALMRTNPAMSLLTAFVHLFASVAVTVFFFVFSREQLR